MQVRSAGKTVLRWFVWLLLAWIFVRGIVSFIPQSAATGAPQQAAQPPVEPAGLRAVPEIFAQEYLTWRPGGAEERASRLQPYLAQHLDRQAGWSASDSASGQRVEQTWVYEVQPVSPTRWQVTVAARVQPYREQVEPNPAAAQLIFLAIPLGKAEPGWVVYDYPSLLPTPVAGTFAEPLFYGQEQSDEGGRIRALLTDFFKGYLGGGDITYYLTPDLSLTPIQSGWSLLQVADLRLIQTDDSLWALVGVAAQDRTATYTYRYTVKLTERDGRWYVAGLLQKGD